MKKMIAVLILTASAVSAGCSDEEILKTYQCPTDYPYFNPNDMRCYTSMDAADEANQHGNQADSQEAEVQDGADSAEG